MKILITGVTGYIGRRLMERLKHENKIKLRLFVRKAGALTDLEKNSKLQRVLSMKR